MALQPFSFIGDYPKDRNNGWHHNVQGVTHDGGNWYITQKGRLWKIPVTRDLNLDVGGTEPGVRSVRLADLDLGAYDHFGDLDHYRGKLYVPLEHGGGSLMPLVLVFSAATLRLEACGGLIAQRHDKKAPWCAINPVDGRLYSSSFWIDEEHGHLRCYDRSFRYLREVRLHDARGRLATVDRVQGGVFSASGKLYLSSDTGEGGILGFDMGTRRQIAHTPVDYSPNGSTGEELEGITIWDFDADPSPSPPGIGGQLHLLMIDLDVFSDDDLYFKHYRVQRADRGEL